MKCPKCNYNLGDYRDKFCTNCGVCLEPAIFKSHEKVVLGISLVVGLVTAGSLGFIFYILYGILVWNIFT